MQFPEQLKDAFLGPKDASGKRPGTRQSCQGCEQNFRLVEVTQDGKKSKSWTVANISWGVKEPQFCECFLVKCPSCGEPCQAVITSVKHNVAELVAAKPSLTPSKKP